MSYGYTRRQPSSGEFMACCETPSPLGQFDWMVLAVLGCVEMRWS